MSRQSRRQRGLHLRRSRGRRLWQQILVVQLAILAVTSVIGRPIGVMVFGHLGDRLGRTRLLVISLTMGASTALTGALPPHESPAVAPTP